MSLNTVQAIALAAVAVFVVGLVASRFTSHKLVRYLLRPVLYLLVALGMFALFSCSVHKIQWGGGYAQAEIQLSFRDAKGTPIEGVELRVEDRDGRECFYYPVSDYAPGQIPKSDHDGLMVLHHVSQGLEFGGSQVDLFFLIPIDTQPAPVFLCRFLHQGREVYRSSFSELDRRGEASEPGPEVKRRWQWPSWPEADRLAQPRGGAGEASRDRGPDRNGDGIVSPEEAAVRHAAISRADAKLTAQRAGKPEGEEIVFPVIRRTITVTLEK
jgi:hypothetical protein